MASLFEVFPRRLVALVAIPFLLGLSLLVVLVDLPPIGWAIFYFFVIGGISVLVLIGLHVYLLEHQQGEVGGSK